MWTDYPILRKYYVNWLSYIKEVLCELMIILLEYAKTVMFHWMFIEVKKKNLEQICVIFL